MSSGGPVGRLAIVLHTHMPYVLGHGVWPFGEQWLWEVVAESYLRVADVVRGAPVTLGLTPVLADQFEQMRGTPGDRFVEWIDEAREYNFGEDLAAFRKVGRPELSTALELQLADFRSAARRFEGEFGRDLNALVGAHAAGGGELLGGPATHAILPQLASDFGIDLQLGTGMRSHAERFGAAHGAWLPECAWDEGLDVALERNGVDYFCVDQSAAFGAPALENLEPVATPAGPVALPIDWQMIARVWDEHGYPSAAAYRSTFARTVHGLMPYDNSGAGWNQAAARAQARTDAEDFLQVLATRLKRHASERGRPGLSVFAADTELFGHWWYEGPWWLEHVLAGAERHGIELVTLATAVSAAEPSARALTRSTWGRDKSFATWDSPATAEIVWSQRRAELDLEHALARAAGRDAAGEAIAELLALQASDWAFIESERSAGDYGAMRFAGHLAAFERALGRLNG
jgi:1,4-alpha-glucan branching enzyme